MTILKDKYLKKIFLIFTVPMIILLVLSFVFGMLSRYEYEKNSTISNYNENSAYKAELSSRSYTLNDGFALKDPSYFRSNIETTSPQETFSSPAPVEIDKKIIRTGRLTLKVSDADKAVEEITAIARANGGDVFSSNIFENYKKIKSGSVTVKVPVANFEKAFEEIKKVASLVERESISGQDVTDQYVDLQAQLKNKQAEEQAFAKILERSEGIDEVLKVTRELARVRGEIEVLQGKIRLMNSQTDMSAITADISEDTQITITDKWRPLQVIKESVNKLISDLQDYINFVIKLVIHVIPILVLYFALFWIVFVSGRKIYRRMKNSKNTQTPPSPPTQ